MGWLSVVGRLSLSRHGEDIGGVGGSVVPRLEVALPARKLHVLPCYKFNLGCGGGEEGCCSCLGGAHTDRARSPSCSYPFIAAPPRVGINCHSCLRRVINCRNLSCAGIIGAASKFPRERGGGERAFYLAIYNILRFSRSCRPSKQIRKFVETSYARISPIARDSGRCVTT